MVLSPPDGRMLITVVLKVVGNALVVIVVVAEIRLPLVEVA